MPFLNNPGMNAVSDSPSGFGMPMVPQSHNPVGMANQFQSGIRSLEDKLAELGRRYQQMSALGASPVDMAAIQSEIQRLGTQLGRAQQDAQQFMATNAMKQRQRATMLPNPTIGPGGAPNQTNTNSAQLYQLLAGLFSGGGGSGAGRMW